VLKEATPFALVVAFAAVIVTVAPDPLVEIPWAEVPAIVKACVEGVAAEPSVLTDLTTASLRLTAPVDTPKSAVANEAIPLLVVVASSPEYVTVFVEAS